MVPEFIGRLRHVVRVEVMRRRAGHDTHIEQFARDQRRVLQVPDANGDVHALLDKIDAAVVEIEVEADLRVPFRERSDRLAHVPYTERQRQGDTQCAAQLAVLLLCRRLGLIEIGEDARAVLVEAAPRIRQVQRARRAPQQLHAEALLERRDAPADGRLGRVEPVCRRREAASLHDGHKCL